MNDRMRDSDGPRDFLAGDVVEVARSGDLEAKTSLRPTPAKSPASRSDGGDAPIVETSGEDGVFTREGSDRTPRSMAAPMPAGAATLSEAGLVLSCNAPLATLLGVPAQEVVKAPFSSFLEAKDTLLLAAMLREAGGGPSRGEISIRTAAAGSVPALVSLTLVPLETGHVISLIVTDPGESRRLEEERARLQRERMARMAAEEANRMKDEFLATLSHELRSPLTAIVAWSHVLREPNVDPVTATRAIEAIDRNVLNHARLVADILDVSRIVAGKFHLTRRRVRMAEVIESALDEVRPAARARHIQLELAIDSAALVSGDAGRLQQVIWNLLSNATKFAHDGGVVKVRLEDRGALLECSVTDDGPGIDPAFLPYVFDRFRQGDASSTRQHGGLGLGLAVVRHLVELHGGSVEARNRRDSPGAVFVVLLPRRHATSDDPPAPDRRVSPGGSRRAIAVARPAQAPAHLR